jgi:integral membrane protein (TIGR01906 family)
VFNAAEASHLADVKQAVNGVQAAAWALLIAFLALLTRADARFAFSRGFGLLLALIGILAIAPFDAVFAQFHEILFVSGTWVFPADSTIIALYPFSFFQAFFRELLTLIVVFSAALATISLVQNNNL